MGRAFIGAALIVAACSEQAATTTGANEAPEPVARAVDAAPPPWWETTDPCPDGASLDRSEAGVLTCRKADGTAHGRFVELRDDKTPRLEGAYVDGQRDGTFTSYAPTGRALGSSTFERGTGRWVEYADDGSISLEGPYRDGKRAGDWRWRWTADAGATKLEYIATYRAGSVVKTTLFRDGVEIKTEDADSAAIKLPEGAPPHRAAGVLGALAQQQGGAFASLTGSADFSSGLDDIDVYGGLIGNEIGEMQGGLGYSIKGTGPGGGGTGWGTIGTGRYGTIGKGGGGGRTGYGVRGKKLGRAPSVRMGNASVAGDLDKNIIRRYVRRALQRVRYCYEKRLLVKPKLKGKMTLSFTIAPNGNVVAAKAQGFDKAVDSCVTAVIRAIRFPKPKGGGLVKVRYPMTLTPAS